MNGVGLALMLFAALRSSYNSFFVSSSMPLDIIGLHGHAREALLSRRRLSRLRLAAARDRRDLCRLDPCCCRSHRRRRTKAHASFAKARIQPSVPVMVTTQVATLLFAIDCVFLGFV